MEKEADFQITYSTKDGIFEIIMTGKLIEADHDRMSAEMTAIIKEAGANLVLVDIRGLHGRLSIIQTYLRVRNYPSHVYNTYIAMLDTQENVYYGSFYEDTAVNAGMKLKFFTNIDLARNWLKKAKM
jgi:hypothetical protein